ncbi:hypothetical protein [Paenibacillus sp. BC26]|uniref:hypothetical protein n=1 Tax=Paenibacillus sp. BC26 TaxID=1881032 RepID=UPI0008EC07D5|nr:hypothetical protein [Paenibacillus sp. BC26]SFT25341.1 hypothetical protein SAMN05428962_5814 [Paenibacillus sp. BC26]
MQNISRQDEKSMIFYSTLVKCLLLTVLILFGLSFPYLNLVGMLIACVFIVFGSLYEILGILLFLLAFSTIFKLQPGGNTFFSVLILVAILKLLFTNRNIKFSFKEVLILITFICYVLVWDNSLEALVRLINIVMYLVLMILVFKQNQKMELRSILMFFSLGIILASIAGLFSAQIPGLLSFLNQAKIKLEPGLYINRFSGIQSNPNFFTMDISIAIAGWFGLITSGRIKSMDYIVVIILSVFGFMSISKSFLVMYVILLLFLLITLGKQKILGVIKGVLIIGVIFIGIYLFIDKSYFSAFLSRLSNDSNNLSFSSVTTGRYDLWTDYVKYIFSNAKVLLFGEGIGAGDYNQRAAHNYFIETLYYLGVMGALLYLWCVKMVFPRRDILVRRSLVNYLPLLILLIRGTAITLINRENLIFYLIIIAVMLNTNLEKKIGKFVY